MNDLFELVRYNMEIYNRAALPENSPEMASLVSSSLDILQVESPDWDEYEAGDINDVSSAKSTLREWLARQAGTWRKTWPTDLPPTDVAAVWAFTQLMLPEGAHCRIFELFKKFFAEFKWNIETP